jgi:hypothetical protein
MTPVVSRSLATSAQSVARRLSQTLLYDTDVDTITAHRLQHRISDHVPPRHSRSTR